MSEIQRAEQELYSLAVSRQDIMKLKEQYDLFRELQREVLEKDVDYGWPSRREGKPSLYKSGAEKLTRLFNLIPSFEVLEAIERDDFIMYKFKCTLTTKSGQVIGEGYGACNSREKEGWNRNPWQFQNNILKMAKKRAHVDAVLTGLGASNVFTQDLEDMEENGVDERARETKEQVKDSGVTQQQLKYIYGLLDKVAKLTESARGELEKEVKEKFNVDKFDNITKAQAASIIGHLKHIAEQVQAQTE